MSRLAILHALTLAGVLHSAEPSSQDVAFFESKVRPLLIERCSECHSHGKKIKGGLTLDSRAGWEKGGDSGAAIVPGKPDESLLIKAVLYQDKDLQMPPKKKLPDAEVEVLKQWVAMGAPDPRDTGAAARKATFAGMSVEDGRKFWAFVPPKPRPVPVVANAAWPRNDIDRFVLAKLDQSAFAPSPDADAYTLLRRVTFDLTGLPPKPGEIEAFVRKFSPSPPPSLSQSMANDSAPESMRDRAMESLVDRLLASPAFGERWARHWLDLALYADNVSVDRLFPDTGSWRYRDYVIRAFNDDKPFDEFVREQIAGDLLPAKNDGERQRNIVATAFLTHGPIQVINQFKEQLRWDIVDIQVTKIGQVFLGQTIQCSRCHDHKFDPLPQRDYYALAGILQNVPVLNGFLGTSKVFSDVTHVQLPLLAEDEKAMQAARVEFERRKAALESVANEKKAALDKAQNHLKALDEAKPNPGDIKNQREELKKQIDEARAAFNKANGELDGYVKANEPQPPQIVAASEPAKPTNARITIRGQVAQLGEEVPRGFIQVASLKPPPAIPADASGRLQLAQWLTDPQNPLVARVFVNRVWHHLFGAGIVKSVDYFGVRGDAPSHPELLDWLALRFVNEGWSVKRLIREMVLSRTYRQSSEPSSLNAKAAATDPSNRLLWRANRRRLEAEAFRDAVLSVSGKLDSQRGGPAVTELTFLVGAVSNYLMIKSDGEPPADIANRRSIYQPVFRRAVPWAEGMRLMDAPLPAAVTGARPTSNVPTQSLFLLNSQFLIEQSRHTARRLLENQAGDARRIRQFYLAALNRPAAGAEVAAALAFIASTDTKPEDAWSQFCHAIFVSNEFLFRL